MKNLSNKQILLAITFSISAQFILNSFVIPKTAAERPFSPKHQAMLDDIVQKFKLGNPGDYKGYACLDETVLAQSLPKEKKIFINHFLLYALPKEEIEFIIGHELGHVVYPTNEETIKNLRQWNLIKACIYIIPGPFIGGYIGNKIGEKYNNDNIGMLVGTAIGGVIGSMINHRFNDFKKDIEAYLQNIEYAADEISVETLNCHQPAINYFNRFMPLNKIPNDQEIKKEINIDIHPSDKDRIARIQELLKKKTTISKHVK